LPDSPRPRCAAIRDHCCAVRPVARTPRLRSAGPLHPPPPRPASAGARFAYQRHRPEDTTLYRVVQEELETFLAQVEAQTGSGLPQFVRDEFEAYLECGILAHGFLRVRCAECAHEKLVAYSCKRRGLCPSCGARRMAETAAVLVDRVMPLMPRVPVRQWVLSFPIPLRILLAAHPELLTPVLGIVHRASACTPRCAWVAINASNSNDYAVTSPARRWPTNA